jgi:hypothetical protein
LTEDVECFGRSAGLAAVVTQAVEPASEDRFPAVAAFASARQSARADA